MDEPVLRFVEHPLVMSRLEQEQRSVDIRARLRFLHGMRQFQRLPYPFEGRRIRLVVYIVDALLLIPAYSRLTCPLMVAHIEFRRELALAEYDVLAQSAGAHQTCGEISDPIRHSCLRGDHRAGEHDPVKRVRIRFQQRGANAAPIE